MKMCCFAEQLLYSTDALMSRHDGVNLKNNYKSILDVFF